MTLFPEKGLSSAQLTEELRLAATESNRERSGPASFSLMVDDELQTLIKTAFGEFLTHNAVFGEGLPSVARMEREVIAMALEIAGGGADAAGYMTLGGSESIFSAMHAMRQRARARRDDLVRPMEVLAPDSIHPAFVKACHYLDLQLIRVPLAPDLRADVAAIADMIGPDTVAICGSAPQWPHHRFDPIVDLAALAAEHDLWMHVDACVGGYLAPFVRAAGWPVPAYDLSVPGVCSMSADLHKWGYAAKPASTVLYPTAELAGWQPIPPVPWDCGSYETATPSGTRPGSAIAGAWAVLRYLGRDGFTDLARRSMEVRDRIVEGIDAIDDLETRSTDLAMVIYGSSTLDIQLVGDHLEAMGWLVMRLVAPDDQLQLLVDRLEDEFVETFLAELATATERARVGRPVERATKQGSYG